MRIFKVILVCAVAVICLSAGFSYGEQSAVKEMTPEQKEKAHTILKQALAIAEKERLMLPSIAAVLARIDIDEALNAIDRPEAQFPMMRPMALGLILLEAAKVNEEYAMAAFDRIVGHIGAIADQAMAPGGEEFAAPALLLTFQSIAPIIGAIAETDVELAMAITDKLSGDEPKEYMGCLALCHVARAIAKTDADRALDMASKIEDDSVKSVAYIYVADRIAERDKERAKAVLDEAFEIIEKQGPSGIEFLLGDGMMFPPVFEIMARVDPDKSLSLAASRQTGRSRALTRAVAEVAKMDIPKAISIAEGEPYTTRIQMLVRIGSVIAETDPDKALAIAHEIGTMKYVRAREKARRAGIISAVAVEAAKEDKQKGLALIEQAVGAAGEETSILGQVADMAAQIDADAAVEIARNLKDSDDQARILRNIASVVALEDPDRAIMIAEEVKSDSAKARILHAIAASVAQKDPDRAIMIAQNINEDYAKAGALRDIARAILGVSEEPACVDHVMEFLLLSADMYSDITRSR